MKKIIVMHEVGNRYRSDLIGPLAVDEAHAWLEGHGFVRDTVRTNFDEWHGPKTKSVTHYRTRDEPYPADKPLWAEVMDVYDPQTTRFEFVN
jgi:hypothetical protein